MSRTNNEMVQNSNSEPKKFSILCTFKDDITFILHRGYIFIDEIFETLTSPNLLLHGSCKNLDDDNSSSVIYFITFDLSPRSFILLVGNGFKKMHASERIWKKFLSMCRFRQRVLNDL